ncbi:MAG TPA: bifunctional diaminohydroxyphosphoribosylaminopyrimidine deaminase/5-amino-6-(5-phosphoribosylamino)uracil reductase RibD [Candidatus Omnitrophota bacterium]|nr:bifunctional diaminohydroxyphosphoribosylaminopyrimidine deaminase/5-amino-6-(5-phosphoribosylamino)uracil reductase RibD [Candidatus Omnitrophota bacterium]
MNTDEKYMRLAIGLARKAEGMTSPNPIVGAVVVRKGSLIGTGYHHKCGLPHAEVNAIKRAGSRSRGSTMYVTMEPCDHFGRTPPCTDAIIKSGIKKVVIGAKDPNPVTNGKGVRRLRAAGVKVVSGVLEAEARNLNRPFAKYITVGMPYVTLKMAQSLDGKIATRTGDSKWISSEDSRRFVHMLRGRVDAVMVGANTVLKDDPSLLSKVSKKRQPARVVLDSSEIRIPAKAKIFENIKLSPLYIATSGEAGLARFADYERLGAKILYLGGSGSRVDLKRLLAALGELGMTHILVEGGGDLAAGLLESKLVDEILFFIAPKIIGGRDALTAVGGAGVARVRDAVGLKRMGCVPIGKDLLIKGYF